jgi:hypothetical protein
MKPNFLLIFRGESLFEEIQIIAHFSYEEIIKRETNPGRELRACTDPGPGLKIFFSGPPKQTKKLKKPFKLYKNIDRFRMLIAVPDCRPKTPKKENIETKHILCRIVINTITRDIFSDQLSAAEVDKSGVFHVTSQVRLDLPISASTVTRSHLRSWI